MSALRRYARVYYRRAFGSQTKIEEALLQRRANRTRQRDHELCKTTRGKGWVVVEAKTNPEPRRGLYLYGSCEMPSLFDMVPLLVREPTGTVAMQSLGHISFTRPDMLLQTLGDLPAEFCAETIGRLNLDAHYFDPALFEPEFSIDHPAAGSFPKSAIFLSLGPSLVRTVYRHKEHGVLVDPGGWWLSESLKNVRNDEETMTWFQKEFVRVGRQTPEQWSDSFALLIEEIRSRMDTKVCVFNALSVEPGDPTHSYALRRNPEGVRRRRFLLALADVARQLDVNVIDADRILKGEGIDGQVDFAHFPTSRFGALAGEGHRVLRELEIV